jgi:pseudouridine-5'-phosphate glycosidase
MLPFGVTIPATVPQRSEIPEGHMNYPVLFLYGSNILTVTGKHQTPYHLPSVLYNLPEDDQKLPKHIEYNSHRDL